MFIYSIQKSKPLTDTYISVDDEEDFVVSPESTATALKLKLNHLNTCQNLVNQHGLALQQVSETAGERTVVTQ